MDEDRDTPKSDRLWIAKRIDRRIDHDRRGAVNRVTNRHYQFRPKQSQWTIGEVESGATFNALGVICFQHGDGAEIDRCFVATAS